MINHRSYVNRLYGEDGGEINVESVHCEECIRERQLEIMCC